MKITHELVAVLESLKLVVDGSVAGIEATTRVARMLETHSVAVPSLVVSDAYVLNLARSLTIRLSNPYLPCDSIVEALWTAIHSPPMSDVNSVSIAPRQWNELLPLVSTILFSQPAATLQDPVQRIPASKPVSESEFAGLKALAKTICVVCKKPSDVNKATMRVALVSAMAACGINAVAVSSLVLLGSVVQTKTAGWREMMDIVEEIADVAEACYRDAARSPGGGFDAVCSDAMSRLVLSTQV
eukprot:jgi/Mesvir1/5597/Mv15615-RA.1